MNDLISRQDAIYAIEKLDIPEDMCVFEILSHIELAIGTLPSAERKRGEWIQYVNEPSLWSCSICETVIYSEHEEDRLKFHKWCGCCGADMRGDTDERNQTGTP